MDKKAIVTKTAKGMREVSGTTSSLARDLRAVLQAVDGKSTAEELARRLDQLAEPAFDQMLERLVAEGYVREIPVLSQGAGDALDLDFTRDAGRSNPQQESELEARRKAKATVKRWAEDRAKRRAEETARREAERQAREAEERALREAREQARLEVERSAREMAEAQTRRLAEERTAREAQERAKRAAEEAAREAAAAQAKREAEERARREAAERAAREAEEEARRAKEQARRAEEQVRRAEEQARRESEARAAAEAADRARREAEELARREAEELARRLAEELARREAEEEARREAEEAARRQVEERTRREAEEAARLAVEEAARREAEERARRQAEEAARRAEEQARRLAEELARREAEEAARCEADESSRREAEERARQEAEESARREARELARYEAEVRARHEAEQSALRQAELQAGRDAARQARRAAREKALRIMWDRLRGALAQYAAWRAESKAHRKLPAIAKDRAGVAAPASRHRPLRRGRTLAFAVLASLAGALALLHAVSFDGQMARFENAAAVHFHQPVTIRSVHFSLFWRPHWSLEGVTIGAAGQIRAPRVHLYTALSGDEPAFKAVEADAPVLTEEGLGWLVLAKAHGRSIGRFDAHGAVLASESLGTPKFDVSAETGGDGNWRNMRVALAGTDLEVTLTPEDDAMRFSARSNLLESPFLAAMPPLTDFSAEGVVGPDDLRVTRFEGSAGGGTVSGSARLHFGERAFDGDVTAKNIDMARTIPGLFESGMLDGTGSFSLPLGEAGKAAPPRLSGNFAVRRGILGGIDMGSALMDTGRGGSTRFTSLEGELAMADGQVQLRQLRLSAGSLSAKGSADMARDRSLRGRVELEFGVATIRRRGALELSGSFAEPYARNAVWTRR